MSKFSDQQSNKSHLQQQLIESMITQNLSTLRSQTQFSPQNQAAPHLNQNQIQGKLSNYLSAQNINEHNNLNISTTRIQQTFNPQSINNYQQNQPQSYQQQIQNQQIYQSSPNAYGVSFGGHHDLNTQNIQVQAFQEKTQNYVNCQVSNPTLQNTLEQSYDSKLQRSGQKQQQSKIRHISGNLKTERYSNENNRKQNLSSAPRNEKRKTKNQIMDKENRLQDSNDRMHTQRYQSGDKNRQNYTQQQINENEYLMYNPVEQNSLDTMQAIDIKIPQNLVHAYQNSRNSMQKNHTQRDQIDNSRLEYPIVSSRNNFLLDQEKNNVKGLNTINFVEQKHLDQTYDFMPRNNMGDLSGKMNNTFIYPTNTKNLDLTNNPSRNQDPNQTIDVSTQRLGVNRKSTKNQFHTIQDTRRSHEVGKKIVSKSQSKTNINIKNGSKLSNYQTQQTDHSKRHQDSLKGKKIIVQKDKVKQEQKSSKNQIQDNNVKDQTKLRNSLQYDILSFSKDQFQKGFLKLDLLNQTGDYKRSEVLEVVQFYVQNFKSKQQKEDILRFQNLQQQFQMIDQIIREQSYNMIIFLDMFKELDQIKYVNPQVQKLINRYPQNESVDFRLDEVIHRINGCQDIITQLLSKDMQVQGQLENQENLKQVHFDDFFQQEDQNIQATKTSNRNPSNSSRNGMKDKLKKGSLKMYQYLSSQTPRAGQQNLQLGLTASQTNILGKSPRSIAEQNYHFNQTQNMAKELQQRNQKIKKLEAQILEMQQIIDTHDNVLTQANQKAIELQQIFGTQESNINTIENQRQEITSLLLDKTKLLQQIDKLKIDFDRLRIIAQGQPNVQQLDKLIQMLSNFLMSKKYNQFSGAQRKENDCFIISESERQLMSLLFGDVSNYTKLKQKYRGQTKKYLKELRFEQENFLSLYKFTNQIIEKVHKLQELLNFSGNQISQRDMNSPLKLISDYVFNNLGLVSEELNNLKLKIMQKEEKRKSRKNSLGKLSSGLNQSSLRQSKSKSAIRESEESHKFRELKAQDLQYLQQQRVQQENQTLNFNLNQMSFNNTLSNETFTNSNNNSHGISTNQASAEENISGNSNVIYHTHNVLDQHEQVLKKMNMQARKSAENIRPSQFVNKMPQTRKNTHKTFDYQQFLIDTDNFNEENEEDEELLDGLSTPPDLLLCPQTYNQISAQQQSNAPMPQPQPHPYLHSESYNDFDNDNLTENDKAEYEFKSINQTPMFKRNEDTIYKQTHSKQNQHQESNLYVQMYNDPDL
eukprot:403357075